MTDVLVLIAALMAIVGAGLSLAAWRTEARISRLLARDTYPDSYASRQEQQT